MKQIINETANCPEKKREKSWSLKMKPYIYIYIRYGNGKMDMIKVSFYKFDLNDSGFGPPLSSNWPCNYTRGVRIFTIYQFIKSLQILIKIEQNER